MMIIALRDSISNLVPSSQDTTYFRKTLHFRSFVTRELLKKSSDIFIKD